MTGLSASVRRRMARRRIVRRVWWQEPVVHPYVERLKQAAVGDHVCMRVVVPIRGGSR